MCPYIHTAENRRLRLAPSLKNPPSLFILLMPPGSAIPRTVLMLRIVVVIKRISVLIDEATKPLCLCAPVNAEG